MPTYNLEWHMSGLGEIHNSDHSQMIYCENAEDIIDNTIAQKVCDLLNNVNKKD